jgi:hypothetical protein
MTTSGTFQFSPSLGELVLYAFNIAQIRNTALTQEHMESARMATNLMLARWSNQGVNLWAVDQVTVPLVQGQATYTVDPSTVMILDMYMTTTSGTSYTNRIALPISRTEYASYPNPTSQGFPTVFWFDRLLSPTVTLWPTPDGTSATSMSYYRVRRIMDSSYSNGQNVEVPYLWLEAFSDGLAYRLSKIWMPTMAPALKAVADESYSIAASQNVEQAQQYISPQIVGYYRP